MARSFVQISNQYNHLTKFKNQILFTSRLKYEFNLFFPPRAEAQQNLEHWKGEQKILLSDLENVKVLSDGVITNFTKKLHFNLFCLNL